MSKNNGSTEIRSFLNTSKVPSDVISRKDWNSILNIADQMKETLGNFLVEIDMYPNVSMINRGSKKILDGVIYHVRNGTPCSKLLPFLGPLFQNMSVFELNGIDEKKLNDKREELIGVLDHHNARGNGNTNEKDKPNHLEDILDSYDNKDKKDKIIWYTSFGSKYPGYVLITDGEQDGKNKLLICGGHSRLDFDLVKLSRDKNIENLDEDNYKINGSDELSSKIDEVKKVQIVNHSKIALDIKSVTEDKKTHQTGEHHDFNIEMKSEWSCFYNTVRKVKDESGDSSIYSVTQGVFDFSNADLRRENNIEFYIIESPNEILKLKYDQTYFEDINFFPINTGVYLVSEDSERNDVNMDNVKKSSSIGHGSFTQLGNLNYRKYDKLFKKSLDVLLKGDAYSASMGDVHLKTIKSYLTDVDVSGLSTENLLFNTKHLDNNESVSIPLRSQTVREIVDNIDTMIQMLQDRGIKNVDLLSMLKKDSKSDFYVVIPINLVRILSKLKK